MKQRVSSNRLRAIVLIGALAVALGAAAQSVVKPTGNPPRFPKADKKLAEQTRAPSNNWLLDANDDAERFRRLQVVASGTDIPMWEIAHRYEELHRAIDLNNWEMGVYHLEKLRDRMNAAAMKRPARTQNMEGMFLDGAAYSGMHDALTSRDGARMRKAFAAVREACIACHTAENVGFLNDSSTFQRTAAFSAR